MCDFFSKTGLSNQVGSTGLRNACQLSAWWRKPTNFGLPGLLSHISVKQ